MTRQADDRTVKLEELFAAAPAPAPQQGPPAGRLWFWAGLQAVAASLIIYMFLYLVDSTLPYPVLLAICVGVIAVRRALLGVRERVGLAPADLVRDASLRRPDKPDDWYEGGDGMVEAVRRWDRHLSWGAVGGQRFSHTMGKELGELVDERLRQRYGLTRETDPHRARQLLGERVWSLLGPMPRPPTPRQILDALTDLDRLPSAEELFHGEEKR